MCRHLAYLGPPTTLAALLLVPPHGLLRQSYAPMDMRGGGTVNADGFGVGWYPGWGGGSCVGAGGAGGHGVGGGGAGRHGVGGGGAGRHGVGAGGAGENGATSPREPVRYRSERPIWSDVAFTALAGATTSAAILAAVRSATVGMPVTAAAAAPFGEGRWLFSHNGLVRGWPGSMAGLAGSLPVTDLLTLDAPTDTALLWALVRHRLRAGDDPADALRVVVTAVDRAAPGSRLNLLLTDGVGIWATAWDHALSVRTTPDAVLGPASGPSVPMLGPASDLSVPMLGPASGPSVLVTSEPIDPLPGWIAVPDRHLVVARPGHSHFEELARSVPADPRGVR